MLLKGLKSMKVFVPLRYSVVSDFLRFGSGGRRVIAVNPKSLKCEMCVGEGVCVRSVG